MSELGLSMRGTLVERPVQQLYEELSAKGLAFRPPVYLSDHWGYPEGTPLIGVPFCLADPRLLRIEEEIAIDVEGEMDVMRYLRHEAGHAFSYAYRLYDRGDWRQTFGTYGWSRSRANSCATFSVGTPGSTRTRTSRRRWPSG
jgi:hypothetical protein